MLFRSHHHFPQPRTALAHSAYIHLLGSTHSVAFYQQQAQHRLSTQSTPISRPCRAKHALLSLAPHLYIFCLSATYRLPSSFLHLHRLCVSTRSNSSSTSSSLCLQAHRLASSAAALCPQLSLIALVRIQHRSGTHTPESLFRLRIHRYHRHLSWSRLPFTYQLSIHVLFPTIAPPTGPGSHASLKQHSRRPSPLVTFL